MQLAVAVLPVAIITGAVRNSLVLEGVNDILGEFSCHGHSVATLHKLICIKTMPCYLIVLYHVHSRLFIAVPHIPYMYYSGRI